MKQTAWLWLAAAALAACAQELPHDAPFDPNSPLEKQARASVTGSVRLEGEADHAGIDVRLQNDARTYTVQTEGDGSFALTGVVPGTYAVHAETRYFAPYDATVRIDAGAKTAVGGAVLSAKRAGVSGTAQAERVTGRTSQLAGGVTVRLVRKASIRAGASQAPAAPFSSAAATVPGESYTAVSDESGAYALTGVPVGVYTLSASDGELNAESEATLTVDGGTAFVEAEPLVLHPLTGLVEVIGDAGGQASSRYTSTPDVTLKLLGFNADQMKLGSSPTGLAADCLFGAARTYATSAAFPLSGGDGLKTICVKYMDAQGRETEPLTAEITLDTAPPAGAAVRAGSGGAVSAPTGAVALALTAGDAGSGLTAMRVANLAGASCAAALAGLVAEPYAPAKAWYLDAPGTGLEGTRTVCAAFGDAAGNWSTPVSATVIYDTSAPAAWGGGVVLAGGAAYATQTAVQASLQVTGATEMMLSADSTFTGAAWEPYRTAAQWIIAPAQGTHTLYVKYRDAAGNPAGPFNDSIELDSVAPTSPQVRIGSGGAYVAVTTVTLTLGAVNATQMQISNDGVFDSEPEEAYATLKNGWALAGGDGVKNVYARFFDAAGNASAVVSAAVLLDTTPPSGAALVIAGGAAAVNLVSGSVPLALGASDTGSGLASMKVANLTAGDCATALAAVSSGGYAATLAWFLASPGAGIESTRWVCASFGDAAGNWSLPVSDTVGYDTKAPAGWGGGLVIAGGAAYAAQTAVQIALRVTGATEMMLSSTGTFSAGAWEPYRPSLQWFLTDEQGTQSVHAMFRDAAGNEAGPFNDAIELDTFAPSSPQVRVNGGAAFSAATAVTLTLGAVNATLMQVSNDGVFDTEIVEPYATAVTGWALAGSDGPKTVYARFFDDAGNASLLASTAILLDTTPPSGAALVIAGGAAAVNLVSGSAPLSLGASDTGSGLTSMKVANLTAGDCATALAAVSSGGYAATLAWFLASPGAGIESTRWVCASFGDAAGNWSVPVSDTVAYDTKAPAAWSGGIVVAGGDTYAQQTLVQIDLPVTGASEMLLAPDGAFTGAQWEPYHSTTPWYLPAIQGPHAVWVKFRDAAGNLAGPFSDDIILDSRPPTAPQIVIDGGAPYAVTTTVDLVLSATGATQMQVSSDGVFDTEAMEAYAAAVAGWSLSAGDGVKAVYARFFDDAGNASAVASALVILDTTPPSDGTVVINAGAAYTQSSVVTLSLASAGVHEMATAEGTCPPSNAVWAPYAPSAAFALTASQGTHAVYARYRDQAGNLSSCVSSSIILDYTFADSPAAALSGNEGVFGRTRSLYANLALTGLGTDSYEMQIANDGGFAGAPWIAVTSATEWPLTFGDAVKTVYVRVRDRAGNLSSVLNPTITLDTAGPEAPGLAVVDTDGDGYAVSSTTVELQWTASSDANLAGYEVQRYIQYVDPGFVPHTGAGAGETSYTDMVSNTTGYKHYYRVRAYDDLGNLGAWSIMVDAEPFMPIDRIRAVQTDWGIRYDFTPNPGTFSLQSAHTYADLEGFEFQVDLNSDTIYWVREPRTDLVFNDMLHLKTSNNQGSAVYRSSFALGIHTRDTFMSQGNYSDMRLDTNGRIHMAGWGNAPLGNTGNTDKGVYYAHDITGELHWEVIDSESKRSPAGSARGVDLVLDTSNDPHITAVRQWQNALNQVTGASILYYHRAGADWSVEVVTTTTSYGSNSNIRSRIALDPAGEPLVVYSMLFAPPSWPFKVWAARKSGGVWTSTYIADGDNPALAIGAGGVPVVIAGNNTQYYTEAGGIWTPQPLPNTPWVYQPELVSDAAGNIHAAYYTSLTELVYANNVTGGWAAEAVQSGVAGNFPGLFVDAKGKAHIAFAAYAAGEQQYWTNASGVWVKTPFDVDTSNGTAYRNLVVRDDGVHILYYNLLTGELRKVKFGPDTLMKDVIAANGSLYSFSAAMGPGGTLYAGYSGYLSGFGPAVAFLRNDGGVWTQLTAIPPGGSSVMDTGVATNGGQMHYFYNQYPNILYSNDSLGLAFGVIDTGFNNSGSRMLVDAAENVHIATLSSPAGGGTTVLRHIRLQAGTWVPEVHAGPAVSGFASLDVDAGGVEHYAYSDSNRYVWYMTRTNGGGFSAPELVTAYGGIHGSLKLDGAGTPHIVYVRLSDNTLFMASRSGGVWQTRVLDSDGDVGRYPSLGFDPAGNAHVFYDDKGAGALKYATDASGEWTTAKLAPLRMLRYHPVLFAPDGSVHTLYASRTYELVHIGDFLRYIDASATARVSAW